MAEKRTTVHVRTLERAADILGGKEKLRDHLRVPMAKLEAWLAGEPVPTGIFLKAVDVANSSSHKPATAAVRAARAMPERATGDAIGGRSNPLLFLQTSFAGMKREAILDAALDAAIAASRADMGTVQLAGPDGLRIVAHRGLEPPFLDFFAVVSNAPAQAGRRVVVGDVMTDPTFADSGTLAVLQAAGVRALQSTPLLAASGWVLGVISTHYRRPYTPSDAELASVERIARHAAYWLEATA